ncbi:MAG: phosphoribosyltransferase [Candidatus Levyibacteriota bacterium]
MDFEDRKDAGVKLAQALCMQKCKEPIVLALPRGGLPVGYEVAKVLHCPLEVFISRKIGSPENPEYGIGAVSEHDVFLDNTSIQELQIKPNQLDKLIEKERLEVKRRIQTYRGNRALPALQGKDVIIVDDGLATGVTARAAILSIKKLKPRKLFFAAPVCSYDIALTLEQMADSVVCLLKPRYFQAVGKWYRNFNQVTDAEVLEYLRKANSS